MSSIDVLGDDIRIEGIYNVMLNIRYYDDLGQVDGELKEDIEYGDLDDLLGLDQSEDFFKFCPIDYICDKVTNNTLLAKCCTPVIENNHYSWGYTQGFWVKGESLEEIYENAIKWKQDNKARIER